ncbi:peptide-methionine (S)-S-oxide reductase MsrA [Alkaliphilus serpentinus]|uniref:Peptide methionine sulfoxide reductase MsrA n=1 Tax=Alkaliphilus serpentinus TaxID=1482731 RepID=A0A833HPQ8_9FIRM|nr:peptide-methionine (S)-S-oxide reductase MsrA [Alkaliphilus serpentinus]KAB3531139.1 peptide-methionine (S)-S-oxide reductase MsrA [Alkaliphilus serpentinus]
MKEIVLAGGCFWGVEAYFKRINGVVDTEVGYANGHVENPTYKEVCTSFTGHAEVCKIKYDEGVISLKELLNRFWKIIDPTAINRQGPDVGHQYRSGIFYVDEQDLDTIMKSKEEEAQKYQDDIVTEVEALKSYYPAEEYHQKYLEKNPGGYCHIDLSKFD